jgi:type II secretory pathway pseudopilin PulG
MPTTPAVRLFRGQDAERGSLLLAMLGTIVIGGLVVMLVATTMASQSSARRDRNFVQAVQGADAGVQNALLALNTGQINSRATAVGAQTPTYTTTLDGTTYRWFARKVDALSWEVRSTGTTGTTGASRRTAVATVKEKPKLSLVAFARVSVSMPGSNIIDSYDSRATCLVGANCAWGSAGDGTGNGVIGSNNTVDIGGNSSVVDKVELYDWLNNPSYARCTRQNAVCPTSLVRTRDEVLDYRSDTALKFANDALAACTAQGRMGGTWTASVHGGGSNSTPASLSATTLAPPGVPVADHPFYCYESLVFDRDTVLANPDVPTTIYVKNSVQVTGGKLVNCASPCSRPNVAPKSPNLQIYLVGGDVNIRNQVGFAGILYAPRANCGSPQSNAGVNFFGALICDSISNQGGWNMHFDDALAGDGNGTFTVAGWREEQAVSVP